MNLLTITEETATAELESAIAEKISEITDLPQTAEEANAYFTKLITMLEEFAVTYGGRLLIGLLLVILGFKLINLATRKITGSKAFGKIDTTASGFITNVVSVTAKVVVGITALAILGVPMTSIIAVVGSCGLAIGLALQGSLANIAGGFILMIVKPFSVGDYITMEKAEGKVVDIGIFHTRIVTRDNTTVIIPNSTVSNATLTNATALDTRRVDLFFTASYDDDPDTVERVLVETCKADPRVLDTPAPKAYLSSHEDSALQYSVRAWCKTEDYWHVYYALIKAVKYAFDKEGISIPYPQVDVHQMPEHKEK